MLRFDTARLDTQHQHQLQQQQQRIQLDWIDGRPSDQPKIRFNILIFKKRKWHDFKRKTIRQSNIFTTAAAAAVETTTRNAMRLSNNSRMPAGCIERQASPRRPAKTVRLELAILFCPVDDNRKKRNGQKGREQSRAERRK